uniref:GTP-binding protein GEM n=1 Tax=Schistocephalus solidus TaxID=70667 RepID=A0A0X3NUQ9_SCHSO
MYILDKVEAARVIRRKSLTPTWVCSEHSDTASMVKINPHTYTVQVLGAAQVGKTTMCTQFMTSETLDDSADYGHDEDIVQNVTVDIDNEQTTLRFIENAESESASIMDSADAYVVVYAIDDRESFMAAQNIVSEVLGRSKMSSTIVVVGNKADLVRTREVSSEEGKNLANVYSCGFYEVSISLNHRVNELLVGLVSAIKSANQRVQEERQRLSRIASLKANQRKSLVPSFESPSSGINGSKHRHMRHNIRRFFQKYFPTIKNET